MKLTLNENCRGLQGYPAEFVRFEPPYFFHVRPQGCRDTIRVTPGHFEEEDAIVAFFCIERPDV